MTAKSITTKAGQSKVANSLYKAVSEKVAIFKARKYSNVHFAIGVRPISLFYEGE